MEVEKLSMFEKQMKSDPSWIWAIDLWVYSEFSTTLATNNKHCQPMFWNTGFGDVNTFGLCC